MDLLLRTSCRRIASIIQTQAALLDDVQRLIGNIGNGLTILEIPSISDVYPHLGNESNIHPFAPYPKRSSTIRMSETCLYLHSSGSTGYPKPIAQNYKSQLSWMRSRADASRSSLMDELIRATALLWQFRNYPSIRFGAMALFPFHIFGVASQLYSMLIGITATLYAPTSVRDRLTLPTIPTPDNMIECARQTGTNVMLCVPYQLEQWAESEEALKLLRKLGYVVRDCFFILVRPILLTTHSCTEAALFRKRKENFLQLLEYRLPHFTVRQSLVQSQSYLLTTRSPMATQTGSGSNFPTIRPIFAGLLMILIYTNVKSWYVPRRD